MSNNSAYFLVITRTTKQSCILALCSIYCHMRIDKPWICFVIENFLVEDKCKTPYGCHAFVFFPEWNWGFFVFMWQYADKNTICKYDIIWYFTCYCTVVIHYCSLSLYLSFSFLLPLFFIIINICVFILFIYYYFIFWLICLFICDYSFSSLDFNFFIIKIKLSLKNFKN